LEFLAEFFGMLSQTRQRNVNVFEHAAETSVFNKLQILVVHAFDF
jgi:hypothetical protein